MHALGPPITEFLLQDPSPEYEPGKIEEIAAFVGARSPDHHRSRISHHSKVLLALAQRLLRDSTAPPLDHQAPDERRLQDNQADRADDISLILLEHEVRTTRRLPR